MAGLDGTEHIDDKNEIEKIILALNGKDETICKIAILKLSIKRNMEALDSLIDIFDCPINYVLSNLALELVKINDHNAIKILKGLLNSPYPDVRQSTRTALERVDNKFPEYHKEKFKPNIKPTEPSENVSAIKIEKSTNKKKLGLSNIEKMFKEKDIEGLILALNDDNEIVRVAAAYELGTIGDPRAIMPLKKILNYHSSLLKEAVNQALKKIDNLSEVRSPNKKNFTDNSFKPPNNEINNLIKCFTSSSSDTRNRAVQSLIKIGEPAVSPLIKCLNDSDPVVRRKTCDTLGLMGDPRAVEPLNKKLKDPDRYVRRRAANSLISLADQRSVKPLIFALKDSEKKVRLRAVTALGKIGDRRAIRPLTPLLRDSSNTVRKAADSAIHDLREPEFTVIIPEKQPQTPTAKSSSYTSHSNPEKHKLPNENKSKTPTESRHNTNIDHNNPEIGKPPYKKKPSIKDHKKEKTNDIEFTKDVEIALNSMYGGSSTINKLIKDFSRSSSSVRNSAVKSIARKGEYAFTPLIMCLNDSDPVVRRKACDALGLMGDPRAVEPLNKKLKDPDRYVRRRAANALISLADESSIQPLISALKDPEEKVRARAARALGKCGNQRAINPLNSLKNDDNLDIRSAANGALINLQRKGYSIDSPTKLSKNLRNNKSNRKTSNKNKQFLPKNKLQNVINSGNSVSNKSSTSEGLLRPSNNDKWEYTSFDYKSMDLNKLAKSNNKNIYNYTNKPLASVKESKTITFKDKQLKHKAKNSSLTNNYQNKCEALHENKSSSKSPKKNIQRAINDLNSSSNIIRDSAVRSIVKYGADAIDPLISCLSSSSALKREKACEALGIIGDPCAVKYVNKMLTDNSKLVRISAANALVSISNGGNIQPLTTALDNSEKKEKILAKSLGKVGNQSAVKPLEFLGHNYDTQITKAEKNARFNLHKKDFSVESHIKSPKEPVNNQQKRSINKNKKTSSKISPNIKQFTSDSRSKGTGINSNLDKWEYTSFDYKSINLNELSKSKSKYTKHENYVPNVSKTKSSIYKSKNKITNRSSYNNISRNKLTPDSYYKLGYYLPKNRYPDQNNFSKNILRFKNGDTGIALEFAKKIEMLIERDKLKFDIIIPIPSSSAYNISNGSRLLAENIAECLNIENGAHMLERTKSVNTSHLVETNQRPTMETHYNSIECKPVKGKRVLLFDDIYTQGKTSGACAKKLFENGASKVTLIVLGETSS